MRFSLKIENAINDLAHASRWLRLNMFKANVDDVHKHRLDLVLEEVVTNVIRHGSDGIENCNIEIVFEYVDGKVTLQILDTGNPFNPLDIPTPDLPDTIENAKIGGLGIFLIKELMEEVEYKRVDNKNILTTACYIDIDHDKRTKGVRKMLDVQGKLEGNFFHFSMAGRLDTQTYEDFETSVKNWIDEGHKLFVGDLSKLEFISSAGLRVLLVMMKKLKGISGNLVLYGVKEQIIEIFDVTGIGELVKTAPDKNAAVKILEA